MSRIDIHLDVALRVGVCSAIGTLFADAMQHEPEYDAENHNASDLYNSIANSLRLDTINIDGILLHSITINFVTALLLTLLVVCFLERLKEKAFHNMKIHFRGFEPIGWIFWFVSLIFGFVIFFFHLKMHKYIEDCPGTALVELGERASLVLVTVLFWIKPSNARRRLIYNGSFLGLVVAFCSSTWFKWTPSEFVWTVVPGIFLFSTMPQRLLSWIKPQGLTGLSGAVSLSARAWGVFITGLCVLFLLGLVYGLNEVYVSYQTLLDGNLARISLYQHNNVPSLWYALSDNGFYYAGWWLGLLIAPNIIATPQQSGASLTKNDLARDHNETRSQSRWHRDVSVIVLALAMLAMIRHHANVATSKNTPRRKANTSRRR